MAFPALLIDVKLLDAYGKIRKAIHQSAHDGRYAGPHAPRFADRQIELAHWSGRRR